MGRYESEWYQQTLTDPEVVELTIKVGVIPQRDHVQIWYELKDPRTDVLIAQGSMPHRRLVQMPVMLDEVRAKILSVLEDAIPPF